MKTFIITKVVQYGENILHEFISKNKTEAKKYFKSYGTIGFNTGILKLYKVDNKNNKIVLIDTMNLKEKEEK